MTAAEFEQKWTSVPTGRIQDGRRFQIARVAHAVARRLNDGHDAEYARRWVLEQPYYREDLTTGIDPLADGSELLDDFNSIDAAA